MKKSRNTVWAAVFNQRLSAFIRGQQCFGFSATRSGTNRQLGRTHFAGKKDQLVGRIQERYGVAKAEAERQADEWSRALEESGRGSRPATRS